MRATVETANSLPESFVSVSDEVGKKKEIFRKLESHLSGEINGTRYFRITVLPPSLVR